MSTSGPVTARQLPSTRLILVAGGALLIVALVTSGRISQNSLLAFGLLIPSIILHEVSHGWVAYRFGDDTAKRAGRLKLDPRVHVDPLGTILVPAMTVLAGVGFVGWAKPVPVDPSKMRSQRNASVLVAIAGPTMNLILVGVSVVGFHLTYDPNLVFSHALGARIFFFLGLTNLWLAVINMIPVPPLDGSAVLERLLPARAWPRYLRVRQYLLPVLLGLVLFDAMLHLGLMARLSNVLFGWWTSILGV